MCFHAICIDCCIEHCHMVSVGTIYHSVLLEKRISCLQHHSISKVSSENISYGTCMHNYIIYLESVKSVSVMLKLYNQNLLAVTMLYNNIIVYITWPLRSRHGAVHLQIV